MSPFALTVDPTGKFLYVVNEGSDGGSLYMIAATTGILTPAGSFLTGSVPVSIALAAGP